MFIELKLGVGVAQNTEQQFVPLQLPSCRSRRFAVAIRASSPPQIPECSGSLSSLVQNAELRELSS